MKARLLKRFKKGVTPSGKEIANNKPFEVDKEDEAEILDIGMFVEVAEPVAEKVEEETGAIKELISKDVLEGNKTGKEAKEEEKAKEVKAESPKETKGKDKEADKSDKDSKKKAEKAKKDEGEK